MQTFRWQNEKFVNFVALLRVFFVHGFPDPHILLSVCIIFALEIRIHAHAYKSKHYLHISTNYCTFAVGFEKNVLLL